MESILVLTHADESGAALSKGSLESVTAGRELAARLGAELTIGIVAKHAASAAAQVAGAAPRILAVQGEAFAQARFASDAAACEALCRAAQATIVLAPESSRFTRVMAAVAHRLGGVIDTHITSIGGAANVEATRWFYRQRIEAVVSREKRPWFLLVDPGTHAPYAGSGTHPAFAGAGTNAALASDAAQAQVEEIAIAVELPAMRTQVTGFRSPKTDQQTIHPDAKLLFVAGAGWTKKQPDGQVHVEQAGELILKFLAVSGASLGSSKSLVDQGGEGNSVLPFLTHLNQVGQTGSTPRHAKGLSTCCHGEEPHVVGWRFVGERRAVSLDPNCGWTRGKADVVYVADAFKVMAKVNELLEKATSSS
jgi:electron transfer flavoprotein alpha subunit